MNVLNGLRGNDNRISIIPVLDSPHAEFVRGRKKCYSGYVTDIDTMTIYAVQIVIFFCNRGQNFKLEKIFSRV